MMDHVIPAYPLVKTRDGEMACEFLSGVTNPETPSTPVSTLCIRPFQDVQDHNKVEPWSLLALLR